MSEPRSQMPPFSPVLLAGFALRPVPPVLLQPFLTAAARIIQRRHPEILERLAEFGDIGFLVDPVDLPFVFLLRLDGRTLGLEAVNDVSAVEATATIRAPLLKLIGLVEGRIDGDALFFSRELAIEGETEAVLALRNAVDDAEIDLAADLLFPLGPLAGPVRHLVQGAAAVLAHVAKDLETVRAAAIAPAIRRSEALAVGLHGLEERVGGLYRQGARTREARP